MLFVEYYLQSSAEIWRFFFKVQIFKESGYYNYRQQVFLIYKTDQNHFQKNIKKWLYISRDRDQFIDECRKT